MTVSISAIACPDLAGTYSCVGTGALAGQHQQTITQTKSYIQWGNAMKTYFNKTKSVQVDGYKATVTASCSENQFILSMKSADAGLANSVVTSIVTKTAQGYELHDMIENDGSVFETTDKCILQN